MTRQRNSPEPVQGGGNVTDQRAPTMSVVIATPDCYETIRTTIRHLRTQTVKDQLEIILVAPAASMVDLDESELAVFCRVHVVEVAAVTSIGAANAKGIRQASAPLVALAEDHAFPAPGWAEALIAAHRQPWAAVSPVIRNANDPRSIMAWADFLIGFGEWLAPGVAGAAERLPGNNSSYKRAILLEYDAQLEAMMEAEALLHTDLRQKGHQLYLEPAAQVSHLNFERLSSFLSVRFLSGRVFGAARSQGSLLHRVLYAGGAPLIPLVRYRRIRRRLSSSRARLQLPWGVMPTVLFGLLVSAMGELTGCCCGGGRAKEKRAKFEFHRLPHLTKQPIETSIN